MKIATVGIDLAKSVFHVVAVNKMGTLVKKKQLKRKELLAFIAQLEPCRIALEACGGAHHWAREFQKLGHEVKLIAPQYVKPYVKGNKNDYNDAEAIAEAAQRPNMRFVPIKTQEQQDIQALHRLRERSVKERTALVNQIRGLLSEYGIVIRQGITAVRKALPEILEDGDNGLTPPGRACFAQLRDELAQIDARCARYERQIVQVNQAHDVCRRLDDIIGIGPVTATATYAAAGSAKEFRNGRHFSAWLRLVCPNNIRAAVKTRCWGSVSAVTRICAPCLFMAPARYWAPRRLKRIASAAGRMRCTRGADITARAWRWPTNWPASPG